ncbi:protein chibby homolog 1 [Eupeodes corollae]|uniref:protein chibby homolog 1 n=1 Tax=Eupeodes corollae TaxID=290404 RepID=UPI0024927F2F|nr:protein chibby homolog 1 [Eupeodes corollae]
MPLFNKKYESKPTPVRTGRCNIGCPPVAEDLDEYKNISLTLGNKELKFLDGIWIHSNKKGDIDDLTEMNRKIKRLEGENNLNKVKVEILMDLLTQNVLELNKLQGDDKV